jgi:hypothetical protein
MQKWREDWYKLYGTTIEAAHNLTQASQNEAKKTMC